MEERWSLRLNKEYFKFSCAHFLIFPDGTKERLHGHNYHVACEIAAALGQSGLVLDFIQVKPVIRDLCDELDEHVLLPGEHPELEILPQDDGTTRFRYRECHYSAPTQEIIVLPINNTSVENLSRWLAHALHQRLLERFPELVICELQVEVSETRGQSGVYRMRGACGEQA